MHGLFNKAHAAAQDLGARAQAAAANANSGSTAGGQHNVGTPAGSQGTLAGINQNPTVQGLSHQLRAFGQKYVPTGSSQGVKTLQIGITAQKGIALDHDGLSRDLAVLAKETDEWVKDLPMVDVGAGGAVDAVPVPGHGRADAHSQVSIFGAPCTATLLNLTNQLASLHKLLGTKLLDSRSSIKALRDLEVQIETRQTKLKEAQVAHAKKPQQPLVAQIEQLETEIRELSLGVGEKRIEAVKESQEKTWEAYGEFAKHVACLAHAASLLTPMLPTSAVGAHSTTTPPDYKSLTSGEQRERTRAIEEGLRKSLSGPEGGWTVKVDDGGLATRPSRTSTPGLAQRHSSTNLPPSIPAHIQSETSAPTLHADIIGAYPSSHLGINETPAPLPGTQSASFGQGTPASPPPHRHHSSFDRPIAAEPMVIDSTGANSGSAVADGPSADSPVPMHPTVAETGVPISASGPGPSSGQFARREPAHPDHIVKLGSFGSADAPGAGVGATGSSPTSAGIPPSYEASGREQAEAQLRAMGVMPGAFGSGAAQGQTSAQPLSKDEESKGDQLPRY